VARPSLRPEKTGLESDSSPSITNLQAVAAPVSAAWILLTFISEYPEIKVQWRTEGGAGGGGAAAPGAGGRGAPKWASKHRGPGTIFSIGLLEPAGTIASAMKCTYPRKIHACIACNH
jgi:hypothetical protein